MDANWFLSACAQTSGAIVAVVGGFLASKLVSLSAERNGLTLRWNEIGRSLSQTTHEELTAREEVDSFLKSQFRELAIRKFVATPGARRDFESFLVQNAAVYGDLSVEICRQMLRDIHDATTAAFAFFDGRVPNNSYLSPADIVGEAVLDQTGIATDILESVFEKLCNDRRQNPFFSNAFDGASKMQMDFQRRLALENHWRNLASESQKLQAIQREVETQLGRFGQPTGIGRLLLPLCHLALFGILLPLGLLLANSGEIDSRLPFVVLVLFGFGVAWVIISLVREARALDASDILAEHRNEIRHGQ